MDDEHESCEQIVHIYDDFKVDLDEEANIEIESNRPIIQQDLDQKA